MTRATTTHTKTLRRAHPAVLRAALRSHNRNDTESGRVAAQQRGTHWPTPCGYNRLIEVHDASNAIIATYRYDPFGRRLSKTANNQSTYYFYSAEGLIAEADANGQIIQSYGYAPGSTFTTNPLWTKLSTAGTATYYTYQNDHLGTPQKLLNQSGITVWSATYDAFGRATIDPASTITNNLRFPGQYADQETGLHYNWMRFYDPNTGRYVTSDPIGLGGGVNLYAYVAGNALNHIDSLGLEMTCMPGMKCWSDKMPPTDTQPPSEPKDPTKPTKCPWLLKQMGLCGTCAEISKNYSGCHSCCSSKEGQLRSGVGSSCFIECSKKHKDPTNPNPDLSRGNPNQTACSA